jgi:hypothetical protein
MDVNQQMRTIAKQLTPDEMHAVAAHYGSFGTARRRIVDAGRTLSSFGLGLVALLEAPGQSEQLCLTPY